MPYKDPEKQKEYLKNYQKTKKYNDYRKTDKCIKSCKISDWKRKGVICDDFDALYDHYIKTSYCDLCRCELIAFDKNPTPNSKCLDHDHDISDRPNFRNVLCNLCNVKRR
tara:strand:+ start:570 stop:899 length:330 start_codon:yes stop_codon:yes gene_type:complete